MGKLSRLMLLAAALLLIPVLYLPIWKIELDAPQYPEGLTLRIHADGLKGDVDIINGLNHYIGMRTLHKEDFIEFTILPYLIVFFAVLFGIAALARRRNLLFAFFLLFLLFGIAAMYDFWQWEYDYGHNLDPNAAIKVPGMAYQPPLIGFKQLLNFGAYSIPDIGGWLFILSGLLVLTAVLLEWKAMVRFNKNLSKGLLLLMIGLSSCNTEVEKINEGKDQCYSCKMTITDLRFASLLLTEKGKTYKFDDAFCLKEFMRSGYLSADEIKQIYLYDYSRKGELVTAEASYILVSNSLGSPMGGNLAAFANPDSMKPVSTEHDGNIIKWSDFIK